MRPHIWEVTYDTPALEDFLNNIDFLVIQKKDKDRWDKDITLEEVQTALGHMQSGKAPGPDVISLSNFSPATKNS